MFNKNISIQKAMQAMIFVLMAITANSHAAPVGTYELTERAGKTFELKFFDHNRWFFNNKVFYHDWDLVSGSFDVTSTGAELNATFSAIGNPTSTATFHMDYLLSGDSTATKTGFDSTGNGLLTITHGSDVFKRKIRGKKNPHVHVGHLEFKNNNGELSMSAWYRLKGSHKHLGDIHAGLSKIDVSESATFGMLLIGMLGLIASRKQKKAVA